MKNPTTNRPKVSDLDIDGWQRLLDRFKAENPRAKPNAAIRIENTILSTARYFGGMTFNGDEYTYFEPVDKRQPRNPDGTLYVAWLMVRMDFLSWVTNELKKREAHDEPQA